jgi:hypothetical protein
MQIEVAKKIHYEILNQLFKEFDHYHFLLHPERINHYDQDARTTEQINTCRIKL